MKKRYIVFGLIALDILSIPFTAGLSAQIMERVSFSIPERVVFTEIPGQEAGKRRIVVTSNAPFVVTASGIVGEINVKVEERGALNAARFGDNAQLPGPRQSCVVGQGMPDDIIYRAERKTAKSRGDVLSQSVIVEISYPPEIQHPSFNIQPAGEVGNTPLATACGAARS